MKGDFSRLTFDPKKHYSSVRMQQGRVQLDADWNEQIEIQDYLQRTGAMDMIGPSGAPNLGGGFRIEILGQDLAISAGRIYVDGILCELEASPLPIEGFPQPNQVQPPDLVVDGRKLDAGQWVEVSVGEERQRTKVKEVDPDQRTLTLESKIEEALRGSFAELRRVTTFYTQADLPLGEDTKVPGKDVKDWDGTYLLYLDVWSRHVSALEDPTIREVALGGPDTATRVRTTWQVKPLKLDSPPASRDDIPEWETLVQPALGRLAVKTRPSLYLIENQLYRIEVHAGGEGGQASFKWSRDNGSVVARVSAPITVESKSITIEDMGRDPSTAFVPGKWIEISSREWELQGLPGVWVRLVDVVGQTLTFDASTLDEGEDLPAFSPTGLLTVRQWEDEPQPIGEAVDLGNGIELTFSAGTYRGGDYWLFPVRAADNSIAWPHDSQGNPQPQAPHGVQHHYSKLALAELKDGQWSVLEDYRFIFSSLSQLKALNVIGAAINAPDDAIYVDEDGRVGIGVTDPGQYKLRVDGGDVQFNSGLSVKGATTLDGGLTVSGKTEAGAELVVSHPSAEAMVHIDGQDDAGQAYGLYLGADGNHPWLGSRTNHDLRIVTNQEERVRITADGKVGIGTTDPGQYKLRVDGGDVHFNGGLSVKGGILVNDERTSGEFVPEEVPAGVTFRFKDWADMKVPSGAGEGWCSVITIRPYSDLTATIHQLAFCDDGIFWRNNRGAPRAFETWVRIATS